jgi:hypothetical protein
MYHLHLSGFHPFDLWITDTDVLSYFAAPPIALDLRRCGLLRVSSAFPQAGGVVVMAAT